MVGRIVVEILENLPLQHACFGIRVTDSAIELPSEFQPLKERYRFRTPVQLLSSLELAAPDFADEFKWTVKEVERASAELIAVLRERFPKSAQFAELTQDLPMPLGVIPPKGRSNGR